MLEILVSFVVVLSNNLVAAFSRLPFFLRGKLRVLVYRRVARIWKRGGYFERVRSVQTTLTRIFIDLESVSDGLSET